MTAAPSWFILADIHFRQDSLVRNAPTFEWIKEQFYSKKPSQVIMCGDQTTNRENISWDTLHAFKDLLESLVSAPWQPTVHLLTGNHDMADSRDRTVNSGSIISVGSPGIIAYSEITKTLIDGCKVLFLPWHADHKEVAAYLASEYPDRESRQDTVVFAHLALGGASTNISGHVHCGTEVTPETFTGFSRTFLGHFHKHKTYGEGGSVVYVGSPVQLSFNEAGDEKKGYLLYDPVERQWTLEKNPHAEQFVRLSVTEAQDIIADRAASVAGKMVQITGSHGVDKKTIDKVRKGLQDVANVSGIAPAREMVFPVLVNSTQRDANADREQQQQQQQQQQVSRLEIIDYAREYLANRSDWLSEDGDDGAAMIDYVKAKGEQLKREGLEDGSAGAGSNETFIADVAELQMNNFLGVSGSRTFDFEALKPGVWLVQGKNGAGKTSLIEAIVWCLYGVCTRGENLAKKSGVVSQVLNLDAASCSVTVRFANGLRVTRSRTKTGKAKLWYQLPSGSTARRIEKGTLALTQAMLERLLNVDYTTFVNTVLLNASQTQTFANGGEERKKIIDDLLGFAVLEHYATAMGADNTRVNSEIKLCNLAIQSITGKLEVLEELHQRKAGELDEKKLELVTIAETVVEFEEKRKAVQEGDLQRLLVSQDDCSSALASVDAHLQSASERHAVAVAVYDDELEKHVSLLRSAITKRISELSELQSEIQHHCRTERDRLEKEKAIREVHLSKINGLRDQLERGERNVALRNDLDCRLSAVEQEWTTGRDEADQASDKSEQGQKDSEAAQALVDDLDRELSRYVSTHRKLRDEVDRITRLSDDEKRYAFESKQCYSQFIAAVGEYKRKQDARDVISYASIHIDNAIEVLNAWPTCDLQGKLTPHLDAANELLHGFLQDNENRNENASFGNKERSEPSLDTFQDGQHVRVNKKLLDIRRELEIRPLSDATAAEEDAKDRLASCESRHNSARLALTQAQAEERRLIAAANAKQSQLVEIRTTREMLLQQHRNLADDAAALDLVQLRRKIAEFEHDGLDTAMRNADAAGANADANANSYADAQTTVATLRAEILDLESQAADSAALRAMCKEKVAVLANQQGAVTAAWDALTLVRQSQNRLLVQKDTVASAISAARMRVADCQCELARLRERHENAVADVLERETEVTSLHDDNERLRLELAEKEAELDKITFESKVINRWLKVWKGRGAGDLQTTSFRSFCLERNVSLINDRLAVNIDLLNRDMHDESWGQSLSCELDNELRLVETGTGLSFYRMSEGQRKRMQLALFFATFEVAQNRSAFQPRILFLDEVFDALDLDGQMAVQRWITHYAGTHQNSKIFVVSHASSTEGFARSIAGKIHVAYGRDGSQYLVKPTHA